MTNEELIKKSVEDAKDFTWNDSLNCLVTILGVTIEEDEYQTIAFQKVWFPLLLQQAMYGVNRKGEETETALTILMNTEMYYISQDYTNTTVPFLFKDYPSETEALAEALKFYFEEVE